MSEFKFDTYVLDTNSCELRKADHIIRLEPQVYGVLELLIEKSGEIVTRDDLRNIVWDGVYVSNNMIDTRIKAARAKIGDNGREQKYIKTYPKCGYKFIGEIEVARDDDEVNANPQTPDEFSNAVTTHDEDKAITPKAPVLKFSKKYAMVIFLVGAILAAISIFTLSNWSLLSRSMR